MNPLGCRAKMVCRKSDRSRSQLVELSGAWGLQMKNKTIGAIACFLWLFFAFSCLDSLAGSSTATQVPTQQDLPAQILSDHLSDHLSDQDKVVPVKRALPKVDPAYQDNPNDDRETRLLKERIRAAMDETAAKTERVNGGQDQVFYLLDSQLRLAEAMLDFHKEPDKIISLLEQQITAHRKIEENRKLRYENGIGRPDDYALATYFRAGAELRLLRAKMKYGFDEGDE
jgi:hypothetical protein